MLSEVFYLHNDVFSEVCIFGCFLLQNCFNFYPYNPSWNIVLFKSIQNHTKFWGLRCVYIQDAITNGVYVCISVFVISFGNLVLYSTASIMLWLFYREYEYISFLFICTRNRNKKVFLRSFPLKYSTPKIETISIFFVILLIPYYTWR